MGSKFTRVEKVVRNSFDVGLLLGFLLGRLPGETAPRIVNKSPRQIEKILEEDIERIFKIVEEKQSGVDW